MLSQTIPMDNKSDGKGDEQVPVKGSGGKAGLEGVSQDVWFASLFNNDGDAKQWLFDAMRAILGSRESDGATEAVLAADADVVERGGNHDSAIEVAVRKLMAQEIRVTQQLMRRAGQVSAKAKAAGEFTFGSQQDFIGGLQGLIGQPSGLDEKQWLQQMSREHCSVVDGWGISTRAWITSNYRLRTTPRREFIWVYQCQEEDKSPPYIVGGLQKDGTEDVGLRRQAIQFETLFSEVWPILFFLSKRSCRL